MNEKNIIGCLLILAFASCQKDQVANSSITLNNLKGKWLIQDSNTKITQQSSEKNFVYQEDELIATPTLPEIKDWNHIVITDNTALLITHNKQVTNLGSFFIINNSVKLLDYYNNNMHMLLQIELMTSSNGFAFYSCEKVIDEDENYSISTVRVQINKQ